MTKHKKKGGQSCEEKLKRCKRKKRHLKKAVQSHGYNLRSMGQNVAHFLVKNRIPEMVGNQALQFAKQSLLG